MSFASRSGLSCVRLASSVKTLAGGCRTPRWLAFVITLALVPQLAPQLAQAQDVPPTISFKATPLANNQVCIEGSIDDEGGPNNLTISLGGVVGGTCTTDDDGNFTCVTTASSLGQISASFMDRDGISSGGGADLTNPEPSIDFSVEANGSGYFTIQGRVLDTAPGGLEVWFTGFDDLCGVYTVTDDDGTFEICVPLAATDVGLIEANTVNCWGQTDSQVDYVDATR